jgi:hypothetical protein
MIEFASALANMDLSSFEPLPDADAGHPMPPRNHAESHEQQPSYGGAQSKMQPIKG